MRILTRPPANVRRRRRLTAAFAVVISAALFPATSASALSPRTQELIRADVRNVRVEAGIVRIVATYWCDARYALAAERAVTDGYIAIQTDKMGGFEAVCDGETHTVVYERAIADASCGGPGEFPATCDTVLRVGVGIRIEEGVIAAYGGPYPGELFAFEQDALPLWDGQRVRRSEYLADVEFRRVFVNNRDRLVVGLWYRCPDGWHVNPGDYYWDVVPGPRLDWAEIVVSQGGTDEDGKPWRWDSFADEVVCDGEKHPVVKRYPIAKGYQRPLDVGRPVRVDARLLVDGMVGQSDARADAYDALTALPG